MRIVPLLALFVLIIGGFSGPAAAQISQGNDDAGPPRISFNSESGDYMEGQPVIITVNGEFAVEPTHVEVRCLDCPEDHRVFTATYREVRVFPHDFPRAEASQPHWNGTWRVSVVSSTGPNGVTLVSRDFDVWLTDIYTDEDGVLEPGNVLKVRASGYTQGSRVTVRILRTLPEGGQEVAWNDNRRAIGDGGVAQFGWSVPLSEAEHLNCPPNVDGHRPCRTYTVEVLPTVASDKERESQLLDLRPATIQVDGTVNPEAPMRTETTSALLQFKYSSGRIAPPSAFVTDDNPHGDVRVRLERLLVETPNAEPHVLAERDARFVSGEWVWLANWTIPRSLNLSATNDAETYRFRWAVEEQTDAYGNALPYTPLDTFPIKRYRMRPHVAEQPLELERLVHGRFVLNFTYADGTAFEAGDNMSQLSGVLEPLKPNGEPETGGETIRLTAEHEEGALWSFTHRYSKTFPDLGLWRLRFDGTPLGTTARDRWGNVLLDNASRPFTLTVAKPRIEFLTIADGEERNATRGLDRGDRVQLRATVTYPDGAPINQTDLKYPEHRDGLLVRVHQVGEGGAEIRSQDIRLKQWRPFRGEWQGSLTILTNRSGAPVGDWEFEVVVEDNVTATPNRNATRFTRAVNPETLRVSTRVQPITRITPGTAAAWTFRVRDSGGDFVDDTRAGAALRVDVHRWAGNGADDVIIRDLRPLWDPDRRAWTVVWQPPKGTPPATYAFAARGADLQGNTVEPDAFSRPFKLYVEAQERDAIIQPPLTAARGDAVIAAFDGKPSDRDGAGNVTLQLMLERYSEGQGAWVTAQLNLLEPELSTDTEHVARWESTLTSAVGKYRFAIYGRTDDHEPIVGHTRNFTLKPQNVTRAIIEAPAPFAPKGATVEALVERRTRAAGGFDRFQSIEVLGANEDAGRVRVDLVEDAWRVRWKVPLHLTPGEYVIELRGVDKSENPITAHIGPITVGAVNLTVEPLVSPAPTVPRGKAAGFMFRAFYPDRTLMTDDHGTPRVTVLKAGAPHAEASTRFDGVNWHAKWTPDPLEDLTSYSFSVSGADVAGNVIQEGRSDVFRLEGGIVTRNFTKAPQETVRRLDLVTARVPASSIDDWVAFRLIRFGTHHPGTSGNRQNDGEFVGAIAHNWNPALGVYEMEWRPPKDARVGYYQIRMEGETANGNALTAESGIIKVDPLIISGRMLGSITEFPLGETRTFRARVAYPDGTILTPSDGEPTFRVLFNNRPVANQPVVEYDAERGLWAASWTFPNALPPGTFNIQMSGSDAYGNSIPSVVGRPANHQPSRVEQLTGATVPGFDLFAALAAGGVALALHRGAAARRD